MLLVVFYHIGDDISYPVKWGLFHKPWNSSVLIKQPGWLNGSRLRGVLWLILTQLLTWKRLYFMLPNGWVRYPGTLQGTHIFLGSTPGRHVASGKWRFMLRSATKKCKNPGLTATDPTFGMFGKSSAQEFWDFGRVSSSEGICLPTWTVDVKGQMLVNRLVPPLNTSCLPRSMKPPKS